MNILNITTITELRGGDIQMYTVYNILKSYTDFNQFVLCPSDSELARKYIHDDSGFITYKKKNKIFSAINTIIKSVKQKNIDIVHAHDSSALSAVLLASWFFPKKVKIVFSKKRNKKVKKNIFGKLKYSNRKIKKIISVSKAVESVFHPIIRDKSKLITIYDAIDVKSFSKTKSKEKIHSQFGWNKDIKIIGNISSLENQKDILTFIDTAKKILNNIKEPEKIKFVVAGEGSKRKEIENYITQNQLDNYVFLLGFRSDVKDLLAEFNIFLLTSISEGLPLVIYESFAMKIPIVATKAGGTPEAVIHNQTGFLAEIKDSDKLSENVLLLLEKPEIAYKITENAYNLVNERFDLPILKNNYYQLYKSL